MYDAVLMADRDFKMEDIASKYPYFSVKADIFYGKSILWVIQDFLSTQCYFSALLLSLRRNSPSSVKNDRNNRGWAFSRRFQSLSQMGLDQATFPLRSVI